MPLSHCLMPRLRRATSLATTSHPNTLDVTAHPELPFPSTGPELEEPFFFPVHPLLQSHTRPIWIITNDLPSITEGEIGVGSRVVMWHTADSATRYVATGKVSSLVAVRSQWTILKVVEDGAHITCLLCIPTYWVDMRRAPWWQSTLAHWKSAWKIPFTETYLNTLLRSHIFNQSTIAIKRGPSLSLPDIHINIGDRSNVEEY